MPLHVVLPLQPVTCPMPMGPADTHCNVAQLSEPRSQTLPVEQLVPHDTHVPFPLQVCVMPEHPDCGPIGSFLSSAHTHCVAPAPPRAKMPVMHGVGFAVHVVPSAHCTHAPATQKPPGQIVPTI